VLESKEVQQALWVNEGKFMYSFVFVNQFFDAFLKGIRSLQSWDEVDIAINNICIVQVRKMLHYLDFYGTDSFFIVIPRH
jgi:hypothetical protein